MGKEVVPDNFLPLILDGINELVAFQDTSHKVLWANKAVCESFAGGNPVGQVCYRFWHNKSQPCENCPIEKALKSGAYEEGEIISADGRLWLINATPVRDEAGKLMGFIEITSETTATKSREHLLASIVHGLPVGFFLIDGRHNVLFWNSALEKMTGVHAQDVVSTDQHWKAFYPQKRPTVADLLLDDKIDQIQKWYEAETDKWFAGRKIDYVRSNLVPDAFEGTLFFPIIQKWLYFTASLIRDAQGNKLCAMETLVDVTEMKKNAEVVRASEERFTELLHNINNAVAVYEAKDDGNDFIFTGFNTAAERIDKIMSADVIGRSVLTVFPKVREFGLFEVFQRVWKTGKPEHFAVSKYMDNRIEGWRDNYVYKLSSGEVVSVYSDVTEQKKAEEQLKSLLEFEKLISTVSKRFINISLKTIDEAITLALGEIGEFANVDRAYLFVFSSDMTRMSNTHEWCRLGVKKQIDSLRDIPLNGLPWFVKSISELSVINVPSVESLPPEAGKESAFLMQQEIKSLLIAPLIFGDCLLGFIGFDAVRKETDWSKELVEFIQIFAEIFSNALIRKKGDEELRVKTEELAKAYAGMKQKQEEVERINRFAVGREMKMVELKKGIAELEKKLEDASRKPK